MIFGIPAWIVEYVGGLAIRLGLYFLEKRWPGLQTVIDSACSIAVSHPDGKEAGMQIAAKKLA